MRKKEGKHMINVLAKPVSCVLFVDPEKTEAFLNRKADPKVKERILRNAKRLEEQMKSSAKETDVRKPD